MEEIYGKAEDVKIIKNGNFYEAKITYEQTTDGKKDMLSYRVYTKNNKSVGSVTVWLKYCSNTMLDLSEIKQIKDTSKDNSYCGYYSSLLEKNLVVRPIVDNEEKYEFMAITTTENMPGIYDWEYVDKTLLSIKEKGEYYIWGMTKSGNIGEIAKINVGEDLKLSLGNVGKEIITIDKNYYTLGKWQKTTRTEADKKSLFIDDMGNDSVVENETTPNDQNNSIPEDNNTLENDNDNETLEDNNQNNTEEKVDEKVKSEVNSTIDELVEDVFDMVPDTGDGLNVVLLVGGMIVSIVVGIITLSIKRKRRF